MPQLSCDLYCDGILMLMAAWFGELLDVKGAFLHGDFRRREKPLHMRIPQGMEKFYPLHWILLLLKTIYGFSFQGSSEEWSSIWSLEEGTY
jgi:hypothetical protein